MRQIEILAPAGSFETMKAALKAGADAVYIGGSKFGARAYAQNPADDRMLEAIGYVHLHGRRLYLTVNTLLKTTEIETQLYDYLNPLYVQGLDAVLVQDLGVFQWIKAHFPKLPIHISTQMTVCDVDYGEWLAGQGASRIVTPRELSIAEIAAMKQRTGVEIETFVHGALCYCYSGQCLMSSMIGGRSGNRGRCAQPCRLPYTYERENGGSCSGHLLSPKDLCGLSSLPDLIDAGVDSLKIEGRMKKPEYAAMTTAIYRKYVDLYLSAGREGYHVAQEDLEALMDLYNRGGFTEGYFNQHNGRDMMAVKRPNHSGRVVGQAVPQGKQTLMLKAQTGLHKGDVLELPDGSSYKLTADTPAGKQVKLPFKDKITQKSYAIARTRNEALITQVTEKYVKNCDLKEKIEGIVRIYKELPAKLDLNYEGYHITTEGEIVTSAMKQPLTETELKKRLCKTGQTPFEFDHLAVKLEDGCYLTIQAINQLRREAMQCLEEAVLSSYRRTAVNDVSDVFLFEKSHAKEAQIHVLVSDEKQLMTVLQCPEVTRVYIEDAWDDAQIIAAGEKIRQAGKACFLALPFVVRENQRQNIKCRIKILQAAVDGFLSRNMESVLMLQTLDLTKPVITDYNLYCMNDYAKSAISELVAETTLPLELNRRELMQLQKTSDAEMIVYGYTPVMISAQCPVKNFEKCQHQSGLHRMTDRMHKTFPVKNVCRYCYNIFYNTVPLHLMDVMADDLPKIGAGAVRLQFLDESPEQVQLLMDGYVEALAGRKAPLARTFDYTKGHYQRGIE